MRIYISVDMEGATGVTRWQDVVPSGQDYQRARMWMTGDVNAAVAGARAAGATEFVVEENHGVEMLCNLLLDAIDPDVEVVRGIPRGPGVTASALDESFDALFLVGHHAKVGDYPGICAHTISYEGYRDVRLGGRSVSEGEIFSTIAAQRGVPTALITGDDIVAAEMERVAPGVETAIVKWALSRTGGRVLPIERGHAVITQAATRATARVAGGDIAVPDVSPPFEMEVELRSPVSDAARAVFERFGGYEIAGDRTLSFSTEDMLTAYRLAALAGPIADDPSQFARRT
jgi:D-amino peptidase